MRKQKRKDHLLRILLLLVLFISACSTQQKQSDDDFLMGTNDPFTDSFFSDAAKWDSAALEQSEVLTQDLPKDMDEPTTWVEKSEQALLGVVMIGGGVAKLLFLPFLGL